MLDLARLDRIQLTKWPKVQKAVALGFLLPNYRNPLTRVKIQIEDAHKLPDAPVIFAMNHTDRFNYWPFQYRLYRDFNRFTATWVKGKYYETKLVGGFMEVANNLPTVSRGYIIAKDATVTLGRKPSESEYNACRAIVDACARGVDPIEGALADMPPELSSRERMILGRRFEPASESYAEAILATFAAMMSRFARLNEEVFRVGLDLLVFPQGTRSIRLSRGRIGVAQVALKHKATIVPIGCNGSDRVYPGGSPVAKRGNIVYRVGDPIRYEDMATWHIGEDFTPFTLAAESAHRDKFQGLVDHVMERIDPLLDDEYRFSRDQESGGVSGVDRFL